MTPWNPTTPFSGFTPDAGTARTNEPRAMNDRADSQPLPGPSDRNPFGFVDARTEPSAAAASGDSITYRTELSFPVRTWESPRADQDVPFYKREITFRRKRQPEQESELESTETADEGIPVDEEKHPIGFGAPDAAEGDVPAADAPEPEALPEEPEVEVMPDESEIEVMAEMPDESEIEVMAEMPDESEGIDVMPEIDMPTEEPEPEIVPAAASDVAEHELGMEQLDDGIELAMAEDEPSQDDMPLMPVSDELKDDAADEALLPVEPVPVVPMPTKPSKSGRNGRGRTRGKGRKVVGLKVGASGISAAVMSNDGAKHELHDLVRVPIEPGIVVDGEVRDAVALERALKTLFADYKLPKDVRFGLASNRIGVRTFEIAGIDDEERFNNAVRFKAHEVLPIAGTESVLEYRVIGSRHTETGEEMRRVLLVVAPSDQISPYVEVCREAGIRLSGIDLEALGLLRAFVHPDLARSEAGQDTATVIVGMGHESSTLLVAGGGAAEFTRVFDWGGGTLQSAVAEELDVSASEAGSILQQISLATGSESGADIDADTRARAVESVRLRLTPFARELVASLQFYQTQPESLGIGEIVITGGTSRLDGLSDFLHQMIGVPVRVGDPLARVEVAPNALDNIDEIDLPSFAVPIGLAIDDEDMRSVNLVPSEERPAGVGKPRLAVVALPAVAAVAAIAVGGAFLFSKGTVSDRESDLQAAEAEFASLPEPGGLSIVAPGVEQETASRATSVAAVLGTRLNWDRMLRDISRVLPGDVWLTTMRAQLPAPASDDPAQPASTTTVPNPGATTVEFEGYTYRQSDVATLLSRLQTLPSLNDVQLRWSNLAEVDDKPVVQFNIAANLRSGGTG